MDHKLTQAYMVDSLSCMTALKHLRLAKSSNAYCVCLVAIVCLDIFRGLRKYAFPKAKHVRKELGHLLKAKEFPQHYPHLLKKAYGDMTQDFNIVQMNEEDILRFNNTVNSIVKDRDENWMYRCPRLLLSDSFFNMVLEYKDTVELYKLLASLMSNHKRLIGGVISSGDHTVFHPTTPLEKSCYYIPISSTMKNLPQIYLNSIYFVGYVNNQDGKSKRNLLINGELIGKVICSEYWDNLSRWASKTETLKPLLMSSTYKRMIAHHSGSNKTHFQINPQGLYHYYTKPDQQEHYMIKDQFDEDYIVSNMVGHFRLNRVVPCPIQFIELINEGYTAQNYLRKLAAPLATQSFLEEFDGNALVKILESIPGFVYKFSQQQRDLISSHHNCVVVGRSGTGKTTCAVMRMIGIRLLEIADRNAKKGIKKIRYRDLCESNILMT